MVLSGTHLRTVLGITHYDQAREAAILQDLIAWNPSAVINSGLEHHPESTGHAPCRVHVRSSR